MSDYVYIERTGKKKCLIRAPDTGAGTAGDLAGRLGCVAETEREIAYRPYTVYELKGWAEVVQA